VARPGGGRKGREGDVESCRHEQDAFHNCAALTAMELRVAPSPCVRLLLLSALLVTDAGATVAGGDSNVRPNIIMLLTDE